MKLYELESVAAKSYKDFTAFVNDEKLFIEDYQFFSLYMKRNAKSSISFIPNALDISMQYCINNYTKDEQGLARAFCVYCICRQIILDMQEWNKPVYTEQELTKLLRYMVNHECVDIKIFANQYISCSSVHPTIVAKIQKIIDEV